VLLVVYDCPLPEIYKQFEDCREQPFAWAWLLQPPIDDAIALSWLGTTRSESPSRERLPPGLEILRFYLRRDACLERVCDRRRWLWSRDA
jgi:hypothetical protein